MPDEVAPVEVGFSDFTAKLIMDVFDAVVGAQLTQEHRLAGLTSAAQLPLDAFAARFVTDEEVGDELAELFPGDSAEHPTSIHLGAPYQPVTDDEAEWPAVYEVLGLRLGRSDYSRRGERISFNSRGVERVESAVRELLATERYEGVQEMVRRGVPRVVADSGRVSSKLTYQVREVEGATDEPAAERRAPAGSMARLVPLPEPAQLAELQLVVRPADERAPQNQELRVDVFGEVEITFRTIT